MEEDCVLAGDYVDVHGRPVEVLQAENGQLFVNLDDVRTAGFNIFKRQSYENATISKEVDLRHFENYLLNQSRKYCLDFKKKFDEDEMLGVFERVKKKLENKPIREFGEGRIINNSPDSKNFTIVKNVQSPSTSFTTPQTSGSPKQLADNFRPSFSHVQAKPKRDFNNYGSPQDNRRYGSTPAANANGYNRSPNTYENRNDKRNLNYGGYQDNRTHGSTPAANGYNRSPNTYENRNNKYQDPNLPTQMRKPNFRNEGNNRGNNAIQSKALANANVHQEPEESWEGKKTFVTKSKLGDSLPQVSRLNFNKIELASNASYKVKVSYIKPEKQNLFYVQWIENLNQIEQILLHVNTIDNELPLIQEPTRNDLCVAKFEDCWYRAIVLKDKDSSNDTVRVALIDYGNVENIKEPLRQISEEMKKIPGMGIRMTVSVLGGTQTEANLNLETEQYLEVFVKSKYEDMTHVVEIKGILDEPKLEEESLTPPSEISSDQETQQKSKQNDKPAKKTDDHLMKVPPSEPIKQEVKQVTETLVVQTIPKEQESIGKAAVTSVTCEPIKQEAKQVTETPVVQTKPKEQEKSIGKAPVTPVSQSLPLNDEYVTIGYDEMEFVETVKGEGKYICYCCKGDSVTLLSTSDAEKYIPELQIEEPTDTDPFEPELFQMCLSKFEGIWYRAIVIDTEDKICQVLFVDFGNEEKVPKTDVKRFPKKLSTIPILGIPAYFLGINDDPKVHNRLKELIPDEEELIVNLKTDLNEENLKYGVEIPSIYAVLKNEKLI